MILMTFQVICILFLKFKISTNRFIKSIIKVKTVSETSILYVPLPSNSGKQIIKINKIIPKILNAFIYQIYNY